MTTCGCRYWANQYGAGLITCPRHGALISRACEIKGITPEEFLALAVDEYLARRGL